MCVLNVNSATGRFWQCTSTLKWRRTLSKAPLPKGPTPGSWGGLDQCLTKVVEVCVVFWIPVVFRYAATVRVLEEGVVFMPLALRKRWMKWKMTKTRPSNRYASRMLSESNRILCCGNLQENEIKIWRWVVPKNPFFEYFVSSKL